MMNLISETARPSHKAVAATLVIGIGSPHGDDRAGWEVVDRLNEFAFKPYALRKASVPHDILDWLDCNAISHIIDASEDIEPRVRRFEIARNNDGGIQIAAADSKSFENSALGPWERVPVCKFSSLRSGSTHQFGLLSVLELAAALGRLPQQIVLWTISIASDERSSFLNDATVERVQECVQRIGQELRDA